MKKLKRKDILIKAIQEADKEKLKVLIESAKPHQVFNINIKWKERQLFYDSKEISQNELKDSLDNAAKDRNIILDLFIEDSVPAGDADKWEYYQWLKGYPTKGIRIIK